MSGNNAFPLMFAALSFAVFALSAFARDDPFADIEIHVIDDSGVAVEDAELSVWFENFNQLDNVEVKGTTDKKGIFAVRHRAQVGRVFVSIGKAKHYPTSGYANVQDFPDRGKEYEKAFARDRWSEFPVKAEFVLKRIFEPKRLTFHSVDPKPFPVIGKAFAIDLETLEWCPPYGNGKHEDATLIFESWQDPDHRLSFRRKLTVTMPNAADGFYVAKMDSRSAFPYAYRADTNAVYRKYGELLFDRREERILEQRFLADDEYLIFRTRTVTNSEGRVTSAHYGRVGENPSHMFGLRAAVWFNPDENDTNLEDKWH